MLAYMPINQKCAFENILFEKKVRLRCLFFLDRCLIFFQFRKNFETKNFLSFFRKFAQILGIPKILGGLRGMLYAGHYSTEIKTP